MLVESLRTLRLLSSVLCHNSRGQTLTSLRQSNSLSMKHKTPSLESQSKSAVSRVLLRALVNSTEDDDLNVIQEICHVLASLNALESIAEDILDKLSEVC